MPLVKHKCHVSRSSFAALGLISFLAVSICLFQCRNNNATNIEQEFVPGQFIVALDKASDYDSVQTILKLPQTRIAYLYYRFTFYSYSSNADSIAILLSNNQFIDLALKFDIIEIDGRAATPLQLFTKSVSTKSYYLDLIGSLNNNDSTVLIEAELAVIQVPVGEERNYVDIYNNLRKEHWQIKEASLSPLLQYGI